MPIRTVFANPVTYYGSYGSYRDNSNYRDIFMKITMVIFWAIPPSPSVVLVQVFNFYIVYLTTVDWSGDRESTGKCKNTTDSS